MKKHAVTSADGEAPVTTYYDILGRKIRTESNSFNIETVVTETEYNNKGQIIKIYESEENKEYDIEGIIIYPNPTSGMFTIDTRNICCDGDIYYSVFNNLGNKIIENTDRTDMINLDISGYANGIYYIIIKINNKNYSGKIIEN